MRVDAFRFISLRAILLSSFLHAALTTIAAGLFRAKELAEVAEDDAALHEEDHGAPGRHRGRFHHTPAHPAPFHRPVDCKSHIPCT